MTDKKQSAVARRLAQLGDASLTTNTTVTDQLIQNQVTNNSQTINNLTQNLSNLSQNTNIVSNLLNYNLDNSITDSLAGRVTELENNPQGGGGGGIDPSDPTQPIIIVDNFINLNNNDNGQGVTPYSYPIVTPTAFNNFNFTVSGATTSEADHIGILELEPVEGAVCGFALGADSDIPLLRFVDLNTTTIIIRTAGIKDDFFRFGFLDNVASDPPVDGVYFELLDTDTTFFAVTKDNSNETRSDTGVSWVANTWYTLKITKDTNGNPKFTIDTTDVTNTTNIPTEFLNLGISVSRDVTNSSTYDLDFFSVKIGDDPVAPLPTGVTVEGTVNEVEVTFSNDIYTVGLPNDVTVSGTLTATDVHSKVSGPTVVDCKNLDSSLGTLVKGTPVYISGTVGASGPIEVQKSFNDDPNTMPAIGLLLTDINYDDFGHVVLLGSLSGVSTDIFSVGSTLYVDKSIAGNAIGLTNVRPTNTNALVQNIGRVGRSQANTGEILVTGAGRTNAIPNNVYLSDLVDGDPTDPTIPINFAEDFLTTSTEAGETGTHGWTVISGTITAQNGSSDNPGIVRFRCSATSGTTASFSPSATATNNNIFGFSKFNKTQFIVKDVQTDTTTQRIYGVLDGLNNTVPLGMYIRKQQGSNTYFAVVKNSLIENTATLFTQDTNWKNIQIIKNSTTVSFIVDGNAPVNVNIPTGNMPGLLTIGALLTPNAGSINNTVDLDFWSYKLNAPSR
jgi:hypothetical protein